MQEKFPLFNADFGDRVKWLRERRGLTLETLGSGKTSTAQSWEKGKQPRRDKWNGIADRLGLSIQFVFFGQPSSKEDYTFIDNHRNLIAGIESIYPLPPSRGSPKVEEPTELSGRNLTLVASNLIPKREPSSRADCDKYFAALLDAAERSGNPDAFPVLHNRLRREFPLEEWDKSGDP